MWKRSYIKKDEGDVQKETGLAYIGVELTLLRSRKATAQDYQIHA